MTSDNNLAFFFPVFDHSTMHGSLTPGLCQGNNTEL
jgi:hypothetical protein